MTDTDFPAFPKGDGNGVPGWIEPRSTWLAKTALILGAVALLCFFLVFTATAITLMADPIPGQPYQPPPSWAVSLSGLILRFGGWWVLSALVLMAGDGVSLLRAQSR